MTATQDAIDAECDAYKDMVSDLVRAQKDSATAAKTRRLSELSAQLAAANQKAGLDDPVAVAAAKKEKAEAVLAATEHLAQLQAKPIDAFEPLQTSSGWFAGIGAWLDGVGQFFVDAWDGVADWWDNSRLVAGVGGFFRGMGHGTAMVVNAVTLNDYFHYLDAIGIPLDGYVEGLVNQNGGVYGAAQLSARVGAHALHAAGLVWAWGAAGGGMFALEVGPGAGPLGLHLVYGYGTAGSYTAAHGLGSGLFTTTVGASLGNGYLTMTGIPIIFPNAVAAWVATRPEIGNCVGSAVVAFLKGWGL